MKFIIILDIVMYKIGIALSIFMVYYGVKMKKDTKILPLKY